MTDEEKAEHLKIVAWAEEKLAEAQRLPEFSRLKAFRSINHLADCLQDAVRQRHGRPGFPFKAIAS